jgi:hypothetical protein
LLTSIKGADVFEPGSNSAIDVRYEPFIGTGGKGVALVALFLPESEWGGNPEVDGRRLGRAGNV